MDIYKRFCEEIFDNSGRLVNFKLKYNEDFNFGYDVVDVIAKNEPEKRALVWCNSEGQEIFFSFKNISDLSNRAANVFKKYGIKKGDRVMTVLRRRYEYWYVSIALHKLGAIMVPVTHMLTEDDLEYRITLADIKAAIVAPDISIIEKTVNAGKKNKFFENIFVAGKGELYRKTKQLMNLNKSGEKLNFLHLLYEEIDKASPILKKEKIKAHDPMVLYFTSGTTGQPKGVIHDNTYPLTHIITAKYWQKVEKEGLHFSMAETGWAKTSWGKLYGQWIMECAVMVYDFNSFDPKKVESIINKYKVTTFCAPPTIYRYLVKKNVGIMKSLKRAVTAGEALSSEIFRKFKEMTGLYIIEGYGQTETALLLADFDENVQKAGSLGKPSPMYNIKLVDEEGNEVDDGEAGEIVITADRKKNADGIFSCYFDDELRYEYVWRKGYYHTGDIAVKDEDGYYWFKSRIDDVIKTGGYRVGPFEVESVISEHPAVLECSVRGIYDESRGQIIKADIVTSENYHPSRELNKEIKDFANSKLAEYKWIKVIEFVSELPKTSNGKIIKK